MQTGPTNVRWRIVLLLVAFSGLGYFNRNSIAVAGAERLMKEFSIPEDQMGAVYTAFLIAYTACMIPGGWVIDRIGPKRALMLMGFASAVLVPMTGLTSYFPALIVPALWLIRSLLGVVSAPMYPSAARMVSLWMPYESRGVANGMVTAAAAAAIASTFYIFGFLMDRFGWPTAFMIGGVASLLLSAVWTVVASDQPDTHPTVNEQERELILGTRVEANSSSPASGFLAMLRDRNMCLLMGSYAALSYFQYMLFYWIQYYFDTVLKLGKDDGRLYATIPLIAMAVGMMSGGGLADYVQWKLGKQRGRALVPACGMFASAILLAMGIASDNATWAVSCITLAMGALGASESSFWVTGVELGGKRGGLSAAILNTGGNAGGIPAPYLTPLISKWVDSQELGIGGWQVSMGVASALCFMGAGLWFFIRDDQPNVG
jgi:sugar phosphate permease